MHYKRYKDPPVPQRLFGQSQIPPTCLQHTQTLGALGQELAWLDNREKSELVPEQVFDFVGYQFDLKEGRIRPGMLGPEANVSDRLLTATEKQVHLGRLHMRPIQWHLKNNLRVLESPEKVIPVPRSIPPRSETMAGGRQCVPR